MHSFLFKYFKILCLAYKIEETYDEKNYNLLFSRFIKYSPSVSRDISDVTGINKIVKTCSLKITTIASKFKDAHVNNPPLPTDVFEFVNSLISCINTTDIDDVEEPDSYSLRDIAKCSTFRYENVPPSGLLGVKIQIKHMCQETLRHLPIWLPLLFWKKKPTPTPSKLLTPKSLLYESSYSFRFLEESVIISNLIPVRKVPYPNLYLQ